MAEYDAFLSYSWQDRAECEDLAGRLRNQGLTVFVDRWYLAPGRPWPEALESAFRSCDAVVVLVGRSGLGRWQQREVSLALDRQARDGAHPVIPVLLPGSEPSVSFLMLNTPVDLRNGLDDEGAIRVLVAAIQGKMPGRGGEGATPDLAVVSPYRGLKAFRAEDAEFFHGRDEVSDRLRAAVEANPLVALIGPSGSGKSSVAFAGLVPRLLDLSSSVTWDYVDLAPGADPHRSLASALVPLLEPRMTETERLAEIGKLATHLESGEVELGDVVLRALEVQPGTERLLLIVDQFEELYTIVQDDPDRDAFISALLDGADRTPLSVLMTLRADFFDELLGNRRLADRLQDSIVNLSAMTRQELRLVIEEPARQLGIGFETGLIERILDDVGSEPGNLPLLEFVLAELWESRRAGNMLHEAYTSMGGVEGAIAQRADEALARMSDGERSLMRSVFLKLVAPGSGGDYTRRRVRVADLGSHAATALQELVGARLVVAGRDESTGDDIVEVAHEALISNWSRLRDWIEQDTEFLRWRQRLDTSRETWIHAGEDQGGLLHGRLLSEAQHWLERRPGELSDDELAFIDVSIAAARRSKRLRSVAVAAIAVVAVIAGVFAVLASSSERRARDLAADALVGDAQFHLTTGEFEEAAIGLAESYALNPTLQALAPIGQIVNGHQVWGTAIGERGSSGADRVAVDWERGIAATAGALTSIFLVSADTGTMLGELPLSGRGLALEFLGSGELITGSSTGRVLAWDVEAGTSTEIADFESEITDIVITQDDHVVAATLRDVGLYVREGSTWRLERSFPTEDLATMAENGPLGIRALAISGDGLRLVTAGSPLVVASWDISSGRLLHHHFGGGSQNVWSVVFSPDDAHIITGHQDRSVVVRNAETLDPISEVGPLDAQQRSLAMTPDGRTLVTTGSGGILLWSFADGALSANPAQIAATPVVRTRQHAISPDGTEAIVATSDRLRRYRLHLGDSPGPAIPRSIQALTVVDNLVWTGGPGQSTVDRWDTVSGDELGIPLESGLLSLARGATAGSAYFGDRQGKLGWVSSSDMGYFESVHPGAVWTIEWSPNGELVATVGGDSTIVLRHPETLEPLGASFGLFDGSLKGFKAASFIDDETLVTVGEDGYLRVWDLSSGQQLFELQILENELNAVVWLGGSLVAVGDEVGTITVVDVDTGATVDEVRGAHANAIRAMTLSPDGLTVASGGQDNALRLWDVATWTQVGVVEHSGAVRDVVFIDDGRTVVAGDINGDVAVWNAEWQAWPDQLCEWLDGWDVARSWAQVMGDSAVDPACERLES